MTGLADDIVPGNAGAVVDPGCAQFRVDSSLIDGDRTGIDTDATVSAAGLAEIEIRGVGMFVTGGMEPDDILFTALQETIPGSHLRRQFLRAARICNLPGRQ